MKTRKILSIKWISLTDGRVSLLINTYASKNAQLQNQMASNKSILKKKWWRQRKEE
jgi:hypothetical protein